MAQNDDNWVQIFDISDTKKHKKGFTIYKVVSMLYPKSCPDSVTKVTVWKRYNDFKKLHRDMKQYYKLLKLKNFPTLPNVSYFHRFNEDVIEQRKNTILQFLEFVSLNRLLYTSDICVNFFKTGYAPETTNSNIQLIRAELNLPVESEYNVIRTGSDEERLSDTDSLSTTNSFQIIDYLPDPLNFSASSNKISKISAAVRNSCTSSHDSLSLSLSTTSLDPPANIEESVHYPTPPETPNSPNLDINCYIHDAGLHIEKAIDYEVSKRYQEAFNEYKFGIDILLKSVKDDKNVERKDMIRHKIEKYLLRAEKIYNLHLSIESKRIQNYMSFNQHEDKNDVSNQSESDLYNYKVVKVIGSGMLVLHAGSQKLFYVKVIHKTSKFSNDRLFLPENVPFMVKLHTYYNCENALFLVLEYISGISINEYMKKLNAEEILNTSFSSNCTNPNNTPIKEYENESDESEFSYSDLINEYALNRSRKSKSSSTLESLNVDDKNKSDDDLTTLLTRSQELLTSVQGTLNKSVGCEKPLYTMKCTDTVNTEKPVLSRKSSEKSEWSCFEEFQIDMFLSIADITKWAAQLLLTLQKLHSLGVICGILQTKNLLIDETGNLVLTYMCNIHDIHDVILNSNYSVVAPEVHSFQPLSFAADWWSYGVILYEMLVGVPLNIIYPDGFTAYSVLRIPKYVSVEGRSLLRQLLVFEPENRLGTGVNGPDDIKTHPFFNSIEWSLLSS
ncbi:hypothetical protein FQR65_LT10620 [Abscondita terminalis]|nr:hypothetical protein FQR65_LT10620 [Abscondita terminalis]